MIWILTTLLLINVSYAEIGRVIKVIGGNDAFLERQGSKLPAVLDMELQEGDLVRSGSGHLVLHLYPSSQLSVTKGSEIRLTKNVIQEGEKLERSQSIINLVKGLIRLQVIKDENSQIEQKIETQGVAFAVRGTDFEVSIVDDQVDLDVHEGEVEVSSPYVQTFVPYHVKASEGFRFSRKQRSFNRRKFEPKIKDPQFLGKDKIKKDWRARKSRMRENRRSQGTTSGNQNSVERLEQRGKSAKRVGADRIEKLDKKKPGSR